MGDYVLPEKTCLIEFDEYPGLEVEMLVSPIPLGEYIEASRYVDDLEPRNWDALLELADFVGKYLRRASIGLNTRTWPHTLLISCALAWRNAVGAVMPPLPRVSSGIEPYREASSDPANSTGPNSPTTSSSDTPATP